MLMDFTSSSKWGGCLALLVGLMGLPVWAQSPLERLNLSPGFSIKEVDGYTAGSVPLTSIENYSPNGLPCLGYANSEPDHIMVLQQDFSNLSLQVVDGNADDLALLIKGPNGKIVDCGDSTATPSRWMAGQYQVWVGSVDGTQLDYTLRAQE
ncbi:MAG: hypothetical protein F6K19_31965 [Cyanothece sp. SIO1E1]|nr:hypothetical protein [Cyanothece sp. SIO1E1]